jgi:hypothetical protein
MESYIDKSRLFRYGIEWKSVIVLTLMFNGFIDAAQREKVDQFQDSAPPMNSGV